LAVNDFPQDWQYYTLTFPVARYLHLSLDQVIAEMDSCGRKFYSIPRILRRAGISLWQRRGFLISLVASLSYRSNLRVDRHAYAEFKRARGSRYQGSPANLGRRLATPASVDDEGSEGVLSQDILGHDGEEARPQGEPS
jgi:hypothetical protein